MTNNQKNIFFLDSQMYESSQYLHGHCLSMTNFPCQDSKIVKCNWTNGGIIETYKQK